MLREVVKLWQRAHKKHHTQRIVSYDLQQTKYQRNVVEAGYKLLPWQEKLAKVLFEEYPQERSAIYIEGHFSIGKSTVTELFLHGKLLRIVSASASSHHYTVKKVYFLDRI